MWWNIFYTYAFVDFITYVKSVDGCSTNRSTATFIAAVNMYIRKGSAFVRHRRFSTVDNE
jgi:hypothetical protein